MKKIVFAVVLALVATAAAGQNNGENPAARRAEMTQKRAAQLVKIMHLTDEDETWFTQLYTEYQDSLRALRAALRPEGQPEEVNGMKEIKKLTDEEAQKMVANQFTMEEKQVAVKRAYYERFSQRLTPKQLVVVFMSPAMGNRQRDGQQPQQGGRYPGMPGMPMGGGFGGFGGPGRF